MKLYETFGKRGFHTTIATSFGIDFEAYESVMLARLRGVGCYNNLLAVDAGMLSLALDGGSELPRHAGRTYTVMPAGGGDLFHPKIVVQLGRSSGRMIVSSANITAAGLAGNLEVAGVVETEDRDTGEARVIAAGWRFAAGFLDRRLEGVRRQIEWMEARTPWLRDTEPADGVVPFADGNAGAFLGSGDAVGIAERFLGLLGERIQRLIVISPYWDDDLAALNVLVARTGAPEAYVLLDHGRHVFAPERIARGHRARVRLIDFKADKDSRFVHAKVIIAQSRRRDHVLFGSANCTQAALGGPGFGGKNAEACLYRALPAGAAVSALELDEHLAGDPLSAGAFQSAKRPPDIPRDEAAARSPGHFACVYETLDWSPSPSADPANDRVELLGKDGTPLKAELRRLADRGDDVVRFEIVGKERPAFARLRRADGTLSAPAIVVLVDALRDAMRDARSRQVDGALARLDGETELGLWLLDTLNDLEAAEAAVAARGPTRRVAAARTPSEEPDSDDRKLTYAEFMAGRRLRSEAEGLARDSLAGSDVSHIRGFLNRLLNFQEPQPASGPDDGAEDGDAFDLGDETGDPEGDMEGGVEFGRAARQRPASGASEAEQAGLHRARLRRANRKELIAAVKELTGKVAEKAQSDGLDCIDLLRLRAMLMIIATAGWSGEAPPANAVQVLPPAGNADGAWPRLLGRTLFAYFGGREPAIRTLVLDGFHDQLTDDVLECWASCMWAIQAAMVTVVRHRDRSFMPPLQNLRKAIYRGIALRKEELQDSRILRSFDVLNERFRVSLRIDGDAVVAGHREAAAFV